MYNDRTDSHELAGFIKKGGNLRLVLVRNAGHSVPTNQPLWALRNGVFRSKIKKSIQIRIKNYKFNSSI